MTTGPRKPETLVNGDLAAALRKRHPRWDRETLVAESTGVLRSGQKRPDILVMEKGRAPVAVETEFAPARTVDDDARSRLGEHVANTGDAIEGVIAVRLPESLKAQSGATVENARIEYAAHFQGAGGDHERHPTTGWLEGIVDDLADAIEHMGLSERRLIEGTERLERTVGETAGRLAETVPEHILADVAAVLHQEPCPQTWRMAGAILTSAFVFHAAIDDQPGIPRIRRLLPPNQLTQSKLLTAWSDILKVNYWPIFSIARDVASPLPSRGFGDLLKPVRHSVETLAEIGATTYHDLCGRMFQTMIADRKFLAANYTLPPAASLLAELAVERLPVDWTDAEAVGNLQVGDFACGTGALLSATQRAIYRRFRRAGGEDADLHRRMMEHSLVGLDIMPASAHLTCSMLSAAHPGIAYGSSRVHTMPYGAEDGAVHIGSLDLLRQGQSEGLFDVAPERQTATGVEKGGRGVDAPDGSFDLVIMNPPFIRPTNHEGGHANVPVPSFAGFGTPAEEQKLMSATLKKTRQKGGAGHGNVGLASNFVDLGHAKLKEGGVLALVLPLPFAGGAAWVNARDLVRKNYRDVLVVGIATVGTHDRAFSADTGMAECLLIATKGKPEAQGAIRTWNLRARPTSLFKASLTASALDPDQTLGDLRAVGVLEANVVRAARGMYSGTLDLPRRSPVDLPMARLGDVAERGLLDRDINGGGGRGAFDIRSVTPGDVPSYPTLWAHDAKRETRLNVGIDRVAEVRAGYETKAQKTWERTASRLHSNRDFQLNSQPLAMCLTEDKSIGGRAWPNVIPGDRLHEIPLLLWANTTLGLISFWWAGTRQQQGRAVMTVSKLPDLPVLDTRQLSDDQIELCEVVFEELKDKDFLPANEAYRDETRKVLDRHLLVDVLGMDEGLLGPLKTLRLQWCAEPSVHGGKGTRPDGE